MSRESHESASRPPFQTVGPARMPLAPARLRGVRANDGIAGLSAACATALAFAVIVLDVLRLLRLRKFFRQVRT